MSPELRTLMPPAAILLFAFVLFIGGRLFKHNAVWGPLGLVGLMLASACLVKNSAAVTPGDSEVVQDAFSIAVQCTALAIGVSLVLMSLKTSRLSDQSAAFFALVLANVAGLMLAAVANDLMVLLVAIELVWLPTTVLIWLPRGNAAAREAAVKHLLMSVVSTALLLYGFSLLYGLAGSTRLAEVRAALIVGDTPVEPRLAVEIVPRLGIAAAVLIVAGLGFRLAAAPFHLGHSEIFSGTGDAVAALLAVVPKVAAVVVVVRLLISTMVGLYETAMLMMMVIAGLTMLVGSAAALGRTHVRQIFAFTTMAHGGFVVAGLTVGLWDAAHPIESFAARSSWPGGVSSALLFLGTYLVSTLGLFALLVYLSRPGRNVEHLEDLSGLLRSEPLAALCASILLLNLIGVPPLCGFWARLLVLASILSAGGESPGSMDVGPNAGFMLLALAAVCYILMTATVYIKMLIQICLERQISRPRPGGGRGALATAVVATVICVVGGVLPRSVLGHLDEIQTSLKAVDLDAAERQSRLPAANVEGARDRYVEYMR